MKLFVISGNLNYYYNDQWQMVTVYYMLQTYVLENYNLQTYMLQKYG